MNFADGFILGQAFGVVGTLLFCWLVHRARRAAAAIAFVMLAANAHAVNAQYEAAKPILYVFTIGGCEPCLKMQPIIEQLRGAGHMVDEVDCSQGPPSQWPMVKSYPTFIAVRSYTLLGKIEGACTKEQLVELLSRKPKLGPRVQPASEGWRPSGSSQAPAAVCRVRNHVSPAYFMGSGTLVEKAGGYGLIVTAYHTFAQGTGEITVAFPSGETYAAEMIEADQPHDLAVLRIAAPQITPITLAPGDPQVGEPLQSSGYGGEGRYLTNAGDLRNYETVDGVRGFFCIMGPARHGDSGGPVVNGRGELVGVVQSTSMPKDPVKKVTACSCTPIRDLLTRIRHRLGGQSPGPAMPPPVHVRPDSPPDTSHLPGNVRTGPDVPPVGTTPIIPLEPTPENPPAASSPLPNDQPHPDAITEAPKWETSPAPQVNTPPPSSPPGGVADVAIGGAQIFGTSLATNLLIGAGFAAGPAGLAATGLMWFLGRRAKRKLADENSRLGGLVAVLRERLEGPPAATPAAASTAATPQADAEYHQATAFQETWALNDRYAQQMADKNAREGMSVAQMALLGRLYKAAMQELKAGTNGQFVALNGPQLASAIEQAVMKEFLHRHGVTTTL